MKLYSQRDIQFVKRSGLQNKEVSESINEHESKKYLLKTQEGDDMFKQHKCSQFMEYNHGHFEHRQEKLIYDHVPSPVEGFDGRQQEMYEIIEQLHDHRVVSILGPPGIGKTSIVKNLANYLNDRNMFKDGTIYIKVQK